MLHKGIVLSFKRTRPGAASKFFFPDTFCKRINLPERNVSLASVLHKMEQQKELIRSVKKNKLQYLIILQGLTWVCRYAHRTWNLFGLCFIQQATNITQTTPHLYPSITPGGNAGVKMRCRSSLLRV